MLKGYIHGVTRNDNIRNEHIRGSFKWTGLYWQQGARDAVARKKKMGKRRYLGVVKEDT